MKRDDDPEKQRMKGQTEVKHTILEKYLNPWLLKITEVDNQVNYIDGFAGWGRYADGSPGSPLIAMQVVKQSLEEDVGRIGQKLEDFNCIFVEKNDNNYADLRSAVSGELTRCPPQINVDYRNGEFVDFAEEYITKNQNQSSPAFLFIDPFGFSGVPFDVVKDIINIRETGIELFITFMSGKMAQYMGSQSHDVATDEILGTNRWRSDIDEDLSKDERAEKFVQIYEDQLREEADVDYVWPFEMKQQDSRQTSYYLVHATNHFDGHKLMKDIMFNAGADEQFAYLGPDHYRYEEEQRGLNFWNESDKRIQNLADLLHDRFEGEPPLTFLEVMKETYQDTSLIEKHYREACYKLEEQDRAKIINHPEEYGGTKEGLNNSDEVKFLKVRSLADFN